MSTWREDAACRSMDPSLFFPQPSDKAGTREAIAVCQGCDVRPECLADALAVERRCGFDYRLMAGIRGGLTATQRARLQTKAS